jgi:hypothetical protein
MKAVTAGFNAFPGMMISFVCMRVRVLSDQLLSFTWSDYQPLHTRSENLRGKEDKFLVKKN